MLLNYFWMAMVYLTGVAALLLVSRALISKPEELVVFRGDFAELRDQQLRQSAFLKGLVTLSQYLGPLNDIKFLENYFKSVDRELAAAGKPLPLFPKEFLALKEFIGLVGALVGLLVFHHFFWMLVGLLVGFFGPDVWLRNVKQLRQKSILRNLPLNLDIMALSMEAGSTFWAAATNIVSQGTQDPFIAELFITLQAIKMGQPQDRALLDMADRIDLPEINNLATAINQAEEMGVNLADILKVQAKEIHTQRFQRVEKTAMEAPVKLSFPLLFIFMAIFLILLGSIFLDMYRSNVF